MRVMRGLVVVCVAWSVAVGASAAEELDPLLEALVEAGTLTMEQALEVQAAQAAEEHPAPPAPALPKALQGLKIGTKTYLSYQDGATAAGEDYSRFTLKRGYLDVRKKITPRLTARITPDITQDSSGDWKVRLKYLHAKFTFDDWGLVTSPSVEFGLAHRPWLDFEEHINLFRMQDTMFIERSGMFNSADAGVMLGGNLGPLLPEAYLEAVGDHYAGRWGSFQVGVYNGGGYHASEKNENKVLEGRLSLRPLPDVAPGFQVSLLGISGEGNVEVDAPDFEVANLMLSWESPRFVATAQAFEGEGNQRGNAVDALGRALERDGWSVFSEVRFGERAQYSVIGRYDHFDPDADDPASDEEDRLIAGVAWQFAPDNYWLLDYQNVQHDLPGLEDEDRVQLTLQIIY